MNRESRTNLQHGTPRMSLMIRVAIALLAGLLIGMIISTRHSGYLTRLPSLLDPVGTMFINAIRVAVIPLVVCGLIVGTASSATPNDVRRVGGRALVLIFVLLLAAGLFATIVSIPFFARFHMDNTALAGLTANMRQVSEPSVPSAAQWFIDLIPANFFKAAADGALLPLIVVSIGFGFALTRVEVQRRTTVLQFFGGILETFQALVGYVIKLAPIGVFALAISLAARVGIAVLGALAYYVISFTAICIAFILVILYPAAVLFGRISIVTFTKAALPTQAVAFTSRSSLAALPTAYDAMRMELRLREETYELFLPIAASIFRVGAPLAQVVGLLFLAKLYGVAMHPMQLATLLTAVLAISLTVPGIPGGVIIVMAPLLASANIPATGIGILLAVDVIPDMFRTAANVTAWLCVGTILSRGAPIDASSKGRSQAEPQ